MLLLVVIISAIVTLKQVDAYYNPYCYNYNGYYNLGFGTFPTYPVVPFPTTGFPTTTFPGINTGTFPGIPVNTQPNAVNQVNTGLSQFNTGFNQFNTGFNQFNRNTGYYRYRYNRFTEAKAKGDGYIAEPQQSTTENPDVTDAPSDTFPSLTAQSASEEWMVWV